MNKMIEPTALDEPVSFEETLRTTATSLLEESAQIRLSGPSRLPCSWAIAVALFRGILFI